MGFSFASMVDNQSGLYWNRYRCNCRMIILQNIHLQYTFFFSLIFSFLWFRSMHFERTFFLILCLFSLRFVKVYVELYMLCLQMQIVVYVFCFSGFPQNEYRFKEEYSSFMKSQSHMISSVLFSNSTYLEFRPLPFSFLSFPPPPLSSHFALLKLFSLPLLILHLNLESLPLSLTTIYKRDVKENNRRKRPK